MHTTGAYPEISAGGGLDRSLWPLEARVSGADPQKLTTFVDLSVK